MAAKRKISNTKKRYDDKQLKHVFPFWVPLLYGAACIILIPWTIFLAIILPPHYVSHHWDIAWTGFDVFEILLFAITAILAVKKSSWTALTGTMLGTVLLMDAWFDTLTARAGSAQYEAIAEALLVEVPLAIICFVLAHRVFNHVRHNQIRP